MIYTLSNLYFRRVNIFRRTRLFQMAINGSNAFLHSLEGFRKSLSILKVYKIERSLKRPEGVSTKVLLYFNKSYKIAPKILQIFGGDF